MTASSAFMLNIAFLYGYAECRYAEFRYTECRGTYSDNRKLYNTIRYLHYRVIS